MHSNNTSAVMFESLEDRRLLSAAVLTGTYTGSGHSAVTHLTGVTDITIPSLSSKGVFSGTLVNVTLGKSFPFNGVLTKGSFKASFVGTDSSGTFKGTVSITKKEITIKGTFSDKVFGLPDHGTFKVEKSAL